MVVSTTVKLTEITPYIIQITMEDRENKNTFSESIITGLMEAFDTVNSSNQYRAVILTGYDNYFCSGGTQSSLLTLYDGEAKFSDVSLYSLPLQCPVPVISAMQGHAIGGGLIFGLFSDFVVLNRASIYTANFMKYGFTPGFGSTLILREKLGLPLAEEMLITANNFRGVDLEKRGIPFPVLAREDVLSYSVELARKISEKPRHSLIILKDHMVKYCREQLPEIVEQEEAMHDKTFHHPEVKSRIMQLFGN